MLKDRQNIESVYHYLDTAQSAESEELKSALQTVFAESNKEITAEKPPEPIVDMTGIDLSLELITTADIDEVSEVIKRCYKNTKEIKELLNYFGLESQLNMPNVRCITKSCRLANALVQLILPILAANR